MFDVRCSMFICSPSTMSNPAAPILAYVFPLRLEYLTWPNALLLFAAVSLPSVKPALDARPIRDIGSGTNIAEAIQVGLATLSKDAMHRLLLLSDGNATMGDTEAAINAANAAGVQIDVAPLQYNIANEVV